MQNLNLKLSVSSVESWRGVSSSPAPSSAAYDSCGGGASAGGGGGGGCGGVSVRGGPRANLGSVAMLVDRCWAKCFKERACTVIQARD